MEPVVALHLSARANPINTMERLKVMYNVSKETNRSAWNTRNLSSFSSRQLEELDPITL